MTATWKIVCTDGNKDAVTIGLGKTVIGRGHLLQIRELKVSRHHAEVQVTEEGEFTLKAMHPGLPCYYSRKGESAKTELLRGQSVTLKDEDVFSLHSNPECEFKVIQTTESPVPEEPTNDDADNNSSTIKDQKLNSSDEDLMLDGMTPSEEEDVSDSGGLPKIGRQKKADSDSDFQVEEDSGSDWEDKKSSRAGRRAAPPPKPPLRRSAKKKRNVSDSEDFSEEEPEYRPRPTRRRTKSAQSSNSEHGNSDQDGKPPFISTSPLQFCTEYQGNGCCTVGQEAEIESRVRNITHSVYSETCKEYIKTILCQKCSPYAAHLYSYEETGIASPLPGLCTLFCSEVFNSCGAEVLSLLLDDPNEDISAVEDSQSFCEFTSLADPDYCYPDLKTNPVLTEVITRQQTEDAAGCMCLQEIASGHKLVTFIEINPIVKDIMYVGEQAGVIHVYQNGVKRRRPFLDISDIVALSNFTGDERGLLGIALHPHFASTRKFYLYYVTSGDDADVVRVSQWLFKTNLRARGRSEKVLLEIPQPYFNHNGGQMLFGDDGYLYIFTGDGGHFGDPHNHGQNLESLLGKALRINVDTMEKGNYTIPPDNPFQGVGKSEIYAYGLRNPWGCSKDAGDSITGEGKGRMFCADVGQDKYEEIDIIVRGGNYGWASREGFDCYVTSKRPSTCGEIGEEVLPIHAYNHTVGKSITGGYVYRGCEYPEFNGNFLYGDYVSGRLFRLEEKNNEWVDNEITMCSPEVCSGNWVSTYGKGISTFGVSGEGDILFSSVGITGSKIYRIIMQPFRRFDPSACQELDNNVPIDVLPSTKPDANYNQPFTTNTPQATDTKTYGSQFQRVTEKSRTVVHGKPTQQSTREQTAGLELIPADTSTLPAATISFDYYTQRQHKIEQLIAKYKELIRQLEEEIKYQTTYKSTRNQNYLIEPF
ncbi:HHIPL1 [Bugula neritina]|uniref:HHIPL1 n=1 Tax=Bugula neritina TaxID=10212 RepID=A0A7J7JDQ0_BUGNE|nr:HHIPL1 [Bugula neritina]